MPVYNSQSPAVKTMKGLHLFHFVLSNCSQRVRLALAEKGLPWTSHHLDLSRNEHITAEYQAINPKGVVPTLVHDGVVVTESNDILWYLEDKYPAPGLKPVSHDELNVMKACIDMADESQGAIKIITFDRLFRHFIKLEKSDIEFLEIHRHNRDVVNFMRDFYEDGDSWAGQVEVAEQLLAGVLDRLDAVLASGEWLSGGKYGLADVSWVVNIFRLKKANYPLGNFANINLWFDRAASREAFRLAVLEYQPG